MTATLATGTLAASWRPIEMAAAELRHECTALDQLVQELFGDLERVRSELELKADEVEVVFTGDSSRLPKTTIRISFDKGVLTTTNSAGRTQRWKRS